MDNGKLVGNDHIGFSVWSLGFRVGAQHGIYGSGFGTQYGSGTIPLHAMECSSSPALHGWQQCLCGWKTTLGHPYVAHDLRALGPTGMAGSIWPSSPMADADMEM